MGQAIQRNVNQVALKPAKATMKATIPLFIRLVEQYKQYFVTYLKIDDTPKELETAAEFIDMQGQVASILDTCIAKIKELPKNLETLTASDADELGSLLLDVQQLKWLSENEYDTLAILSE